jgi:DNA-binding CsgD family transcriptional regulator
VGTDVTNKDRFDRLTDKQRECLNLVLQRKTSKQIARMLNISKPAVDQRLATARAYLGVADRDEAAMTYLQMLSTYDRIAYDALQLPPMPYSREVASRDTASESAFLLREAPTSFGAFAVQDSSSPRVLGISLHELGSLARLAIIAVFTIGGLAAVLIALAVAQALTHLIDS